MEKEENSSTRNIHTVLLLSIGVVFLVVGVLFSIVWREVLYSESIRSICFGIGVILVTAAITERILMREFRDQVGKITEEHFDRFSRKAQEAIGQQLNALFELLRNAEYCGLINILPPRRDSYEGRGASTLSYVKDSLATSENVKIFCISGKEFLWEHGEFYHAFWERAHSPSEYRVKILLADPEGYPAKVRGKKEFPQRPNYIKTDTETSWNALEALKLRITDALGRVPSTWSVEIRFYNFIPQAWFVITDEEMFLEPYHMADTDTLLQRFPQNFNDVGICCGGRVPIFVVKKDTPLYVAMENYFDWLWDHNDKNIFIKEFADHFNVRNTIPRKQQPRAIPRQRHKVAKK